jgi:hypothetical protein
VKRALLAATLFLGGLSSAFAACPATFAVMKDNSGNTFNMALTTDANGNCTAKLDWDTSSQAHADITSAIPQGNAWIGATDIVVTPSTNFTRPANTTAYSAGQLVANSTTAGSVTPLSWTFARVNGGNGYVRRFRMTLSSKSITNTSFRLHLYTVLPTVTNGDGGTFLSTEANEICTMTSQVQSADPYNWQAGSDVSIGYGTPSQGNECNFVAAGGSTTLYGLLEARAAYTPGNAEVISVIPEVHQN